MPPSPPVTHAQQRVHSATSPPHPPSFPHTLRMVREVTPSSMQSYDQAAILELLPQQPPFLFIQSALVGPDEVSAQYEIAGDEFFLTGHFKNDPVFPASILFEALGQAACLWVLQEAPARSGKPVPKGQVFFASMDGAQVYRKSRPGDILTLHVTGAKLREPLAFFQGSVSNARGERVAKIDRLVLAFGEQAASSAEARP